MIKSSDYSHVTTDSRELRPRGLFVAIPGLIHDGHHFIDVAIQNGATGLVVQDHKLDLEDIPSHVKVYQVSDTQTALNEICKDFYNDPFSRLKTIAVTGTNGKTTVTYLIEAILREAGHVTGVMGTIDYRVGDHVLQEASHTTPPAPLIYDVASQMIAEGASSVLLEASSHGLDQGRLTGLAVDGAVFTNLSRDHLDYHASEEDYFLAKLSLFQMLEQDAFAVINQDDAYFERIRSHVNSRVITYGFSEASDVRCLSVDNDRCELSLPNQQTHVFSVPLPGEHNVSNLMAAVAVAWMLDIDVAVMQRAICDFKGVPGRLQAIQTSRPFEIYVDYAHTPDALWMVLQSLKSRTCGRLILVMGCGGDRDRGKRSQMASIAEQYADQLIVTSDNPRFEDPYAIYQDMCKGLSSEYSSEWVEDRREAIGQAVSVAQKGDIVLIAGKGHETYQEINGIRYDLSDKECVDEILSKLE